MKNKDTKLLEEKYIYISENAISYTAVVLNNESVNLLINQLTQEGKLQEALINDTWEIIAHHMTINMGSADKGPANGRVGENVNLKVISFAFDNKVAAVGVEGFITNNKIPHITIAVNRPTGGKPFLSNKLTNWTSWNGPSLIGIVSEVPR